MQTSLCKALTSISQLQTVMCLDYMQIELRDNKGSIVKSYKLQLFFQTSLS